MWIRFQTNQLTTAMSLITVTAQDYGKQFLTDFVTNFALNATTDVDKQYYRFSASSDYTTVSTDQVQLTFGICRLNNSARMTFYDGDSEAAPVITVFDSGCYPVFSSGQYLLLVVEGFKNHDFFSGNFSAVQAGCHGNLMSDAGVFSLESSRMNNTAECGWLVNPSGDGVVPMVLFDQINMDIGSNITVYYGFSTNGSKIAQITGGTSKSSSGILSNDPKGGPLFVQYVQNPAKNRNDAIFKAVYAKLGSCQRKMTALSSGELQSRNFPKNYPLNANCTNNLTVPNGKLIHLYYDTFKLHEKHYSRVIVSNGTTSTVIANYTGSVLPNDLVLNGSTVDVTFSSVLSNITDLTDNQGFNIKYTLLDCGGNLTNGSGNFSTPGYPKSVAKKTMCIWIITVPAITKKMATIVSLRFQPAEVKNKTSNYIMIRDGPSQRSDLIANTTTSNAKELTLLSRHNYLWVQYVFESTEKVKEGFPVKFSYSSYVCNATCDNKMCMHPDWMCDGIDQCGDNTDEQNCIPQASSSTEL
uniref:Deleted in malignant brain tumors 1 protein-like n=1 Tax=Saccoglossus kowalevskii TaxID=10224 RepID=A0ABM0MFI5_SACKO|nr:PREDICTED: deleted in malignant brain tumors 1 protein-like [Saccoglossus kowalevskii]